MVTDGAALTGSLVLSRVLPGGGLAAAAWMGADWRRRRRSVT
jgi:hypothetical protein